MQHLPPVMKRQLIRGHNTAVSSYAKLRQLLGHRGSAPSFLIIGSQKCGTTYLYDRLLDHPNLHPSLTKEIGFFSRHYERGMDWYLANFPRLDNGAISGEATPAYIWHPLAPHRVAAETPDIKLILLLRNPISRAYSSYQHTVRLGFESLSFEGAVSIEELRIRGEIDKMTEDPLYYSLRYHHYAYVDRGRYADQIERWWRVFPREQILILGFEEFMKNKNEFLDMVVQFLGLPEWQAKEQRGYRTLSYKYDDISQQMERSLAEIYAPENEKLYKLVGREFGWDAA